MKATVTIQNLRCHGCVNTISTKLSDLENIEQVAVDIESSQVSFSYTSDEDLRKAESKLIALGYPPNGQGNNILTKAKSVVSCAVGRLQ